MNEREIYLYVIVALLPLSASMVIFQTNPYHALVIRGILGAIAALVYAVLGAADVALTEALVGTMLAITLYAVAVRSSMVMRLGVIDLPDSEASANLDPAFQPLTADLRTFLSTHYMRLELVTYPSTQALHQALMDKEIHAICEGRSPSSSDDSNLSFQITTRVQRLYDLMQTELPNLVLTYRPSVTPSPIPSQTSDFEEAH